MADQKENILIDITAEDNATDVISAVEEATEALAESYEDASESIEDNASFLKTWENALFSSATATEAAAATISLLSEDLNNGLRAYEETSQKIVDAQKKLSEFGATAAEQKQALDLINTAIQEQGVNAAKAAIVMEELAIEYTDAEKALDNYARALEFVEGSTERADVATGDFIDATKGGTAGLRKFGREASAMADAIDKISDPALRARKSVEALERAQRKAAAGGTMTTKVMDKLALAELELASAGPIVAGSVAAIGAAYVAAGAAIVAFSVDSIGEYLSSTADTMAATDRFDASLQRLKISFGEALVGPPTEAAEKIDRFTVILDNLDTEVNRNSKSIGDLADTIVDVLQVAFKVVATASAIAMSAFFLLHDAITGLYAVALTLAGVLVEDVGQALVSLGVVTKETGDEISAFGTAAVDTADGMNFWIDDVWRTWDAVTTFSDAVADGSEDLKIMEAQIDGLDREMVQLTATMEELADSDAFDIFKKVADAAVGPLRSGGAPKPPKRPKRGGGAKKSKADEERKRQLEIEALAVGAVTSAWEDYRATLDDVGNLEDKLAAKRAEQVQKSMDDIALMTEEVERWLQTVGDGTEIQAKAIKELETARNAELAASALDAQSQAMQDVTSAAIDMAAALASGDLALKDLAAAALETVGDISIKLGKALLFMGLGLEGLKGLNPAAMILFGGLAIASGIGLKAAAGAIGGGGGGRSSRTPGETTLERIGSKLVEIADQRRDSDQAVNIWIDGQQMRSRTMRDVGDATSRGEMMPTPLLGPPRALGAG